MSGEMTSARPRSAETAGAWKQSDLPPPVGRTTTLSREARMASIASRCSGRNVEKPHTRWSVSVMASGIPCLHVLVDELTELARQLVIRAAQRLHVLAVDIYRAVRRLAGAGETDADVGGLRLAGAVDHAA